MASKRQKIVDRIETIIKTITVANGYLTNAGQHVFIWRTVPLDPSELDALVLRDLDDDTTVDDPDDAVQVNDLLVSIECVAGGADAKTAMLQIRKMFSDLAKAIRTELADENSVLSGLARSVTPKGKRVITDQDLRAIGGGLFDFTVRYLTDRFNEEE